MQPAETFIEITTSNSIKDTGGALVVFVRPDAVLASDHPASGVSAAVPEFFKLSAYQGKAGEVAIDHSAPVKPAAHMILAGLGSEALSHSKLQKMAISIINVAKDQTRTLQLLIDGALEGTNAEVFLLALFNACYRFDAFKSKAAAPLLNQIHVVTRNDSLCEQVEFLKAVHLGQNLTRNMGNLPGNLCQPKDLAAKAKELAKAYPKQLKVKVIGEDEMKKLGMGCFLSVSQGSDAEGQLVIFEYEGVKSDEPPVCLVGKGVTFDTGGISLKPGAGMEEMKFDMCGAATVIGAFKALCEAKLPIKVVGAMACAENMPSGKATRPGDVVTAMNGLTVEVLNTDAEGRLVLSDTLCYMKRYNPKTVIDMATLTGACIIALGHVNTGLFSAQDALANELLEAAAQSGDMTWRLPLQDEYQEQLDSPVADLQNIGGRPAGSVTAACFLSRFVDYADWAHLDIAGTAWTSGSKRNASGRPLPLIMRYLKNQA